jgi:O-acetylhomoserine (thiol)-lyase
MSESFQHPETLCIQAGYHPGNGAPRVLPICQSTTYRFESAAHLGDLFDLAVPGHMYTRISNPTVACVEEKIAALEGGVGALCTSSGQSATLLAVLNLAGAGQNIVSLSSIYGGTVNLFAVTLKKLGIEVRFASQEQPDEALDALFDANTRLVFGETIANPALTVLDIRRMSALAHRHGVPLVVDNTFATPILCRPFDFGADIVVHSTSKYMDGHATVLGGAVVDGGRFDWTAAGRFPELTEPDPSYHGVIYAERFGRAAYIEKARAQLMRDLGTTMQPLAAFLLNLGLETLALRMERHCSNALRVAEALQRDPRVAWVEYPLLPGSGGYALAREYLSKGAAGVVSFGVKGGREAAMRFLDALRLAAIVVHVADARTGALHPASTTHRQLTDEQLHACGITPEQVRLSVGLEHVDDILADLDQALAASQEG